MLYNLLYFLSHDAQQNSYRYCSVRSIGNNLCIVVLLEDCGFKVSFCCVYMTIMSVVCSIKCVVAMSNNDDSSLDKGAPAAKEEDNEEEEDEEEPVMTLEECIAEQEDAARLFGVHAEDVCTYPRGILPRQAAFTAVWTAVRRAWPAFA